MVNWRLTYARIAAIITQTHDWASDFAPDGPPGHGVPDEEVPSFNIQIEWAGGPPPPPYQHMYHIVDGVYRNQQVHGTGNGDGNGNGNGNSSSAGVAAFNGSLVDIGTDTGGAVPVSSS